MSDNGDVDQNDNPGVIAPPPLLYLGTLALAFAIDWFYPITLLNTFIQLLGGTIFLIPAGVFAANAFRAFSEAETSFQTQQPDTALITSGVYQFTRNPIYLGGTFLYLSIAIFGDNLWAVFLLAPLLLVMRYGVIAREEAYLERKFGQEYLDYKADVNRWF